MLDDRRTEELRQAFERLPDGHKFSLAEIDFVPAILGQSINWTYATSDGDLLSASAHGEPITTAADLRRVLAEHPRTDEPQGPSFIESLLEKFFLGYREIAWNRVRARALFELLAEKDPALHKAYDDRVREVAERDLMAFEQKLGKPPEIFNKLFEAWIAQNEARHNANLGENASASAKAWESLMERLNAQLEEIRVKLQALDETSQP